eukprot:CAMPEP_0181081938 /NCGR_PEP_ID=MMETSP1071-20121207/3360_1 /TAXON_ID=35127 /ORGANISM="Thalassiosira sp., Strain NH16" /LENGTH=224 /DNA_ID=CAMNT_0023163501 /DNA_START=224 /DNA_END=898 /DNA_ORIENTATION=+
MSSSTILPSHRSDPYGDTENSNDDPSLSTTIGDVVQNLHGGKYQFSETQYLAGSSVMGRQFAESLYSSGGSADNEQSADVIHDGEELPRWAMRLQDPMEQGSEPFLGTLAFDEELDVLHRTISIKNDERSWERYYAFILVNVDDDNAGVRHGDGCPFRASPATGTLAPRGGASNACDESRPYSDSATISVERIGEEKAAVAEDERRWMLIVGTEAEVWRYRLSI